jgi:hypothetical protein
MFSLFVQHATPTFVVLTTNSFHAKYKVGQNKKIIAVTADSRVLEISLFEAENSSGCSVVKHVLRYRIS